MTLLLAAAALLLAALAVERVRLDHARAAVPLRIAVTGTRGKTTVARLLASVLREDGRTVLAKTTGSEPCLVLPDGSVEHVRRRGPASILEQKALLHRAVRLGADAVVAEVMSIHAENHAVEGRRILVPHLVIATNFFVDHTEAQGDTEESVGAVLMLSVPECATVFVPQGTCPTSFREGVADAGATLVEVAAGTAAGLGSRPPAQDRGAPAPLGTESATRTFPENLDLVVAAARHLGVPDDAIRRGIAKARHDIGALGVWSLPVERGRAFLVNAFAANDPAATMRAYDRVCADGGRAAGGARAPERPRCVGLLSLRADRGERTLQWADALAGGLADRFDALLVTGFHAAALARRVSRSGHGATHPEGGSNPATPPVRVLRRTSVEELTRTALSALGPAGGVVFGFGNIGGPGVALVEHWSRIGTPGPVHLGGPVEEASARGDTTHGR